MATNNHFFRGKKVLDAISETYADEVFGEFEYWRNMGIMMFPNRYYPTMVCSCTDRRETAYVANYSHKPSLAEYGETKMLEEMGREFSPAGRISSKKELHRLSMHIFPIGQCAEQHAANDLLKILGNAPDIKHDLYFGKPVRTATGEDNIPYCDNCSSLFNL